MDLENLCLSFTYTFKFYDLIVYKPFDEFEFGIIFGMMTDIGSNFIQHQPWSWPTEQGRGLKKVYTKSFTQFEPHLSN